VGLHVTQIKRYESGATQPSLEALKKIALSLGVTTDFLLFDEDERGPDDELRLQFDVIARLDEEERRVIRELIDGMIIKYQAKRNAQRFPADFMFQLDADEFAALRSQTVISNAAGPGRGGRRTAPYAFTEQGVAMLSSVLGSERAVAVNIEIMRTFVRVRALAATHQDLAKRLAELEMKTDSLELSHDTFSRNTRNQLRQVFEAIRELMTPPAPPKRPIGFVRSEDKKNKPAGRAASKAATRKKA
jgi:transcriptional regulator with XRE-family HTH domain